MVQVLSPRVQPQGATRYAPGTDVEAYRAGRGTSGPTSYSYSAMSGLPGAGTPPCSAGPLSTRNTLSSPTFASPRQQFVTSPPRPPTSTTPLKVNAPSVLTNSVGPNINGAGSVAYTPPMPGPGYGQKSSFAQMVYQSPRSRSPSPPLSPHMRMQEMLQSSTPSAPPPRQGALTPSYPSSPQLSFGPALGVVRSMSAGSPAGISHAATMPPLYGGKSESLASMATPSFSKHSESALAGPLFRSCLNSDMNEQRSWTPVPGAHYDGTRTEQWSNPHQAAHNDQLDSGQWSAPVPGTQNEQLDTHRSGPLHGNHNDQLSQEWSVGNPHSEQIERPWATGNGVHGGQFEQPWAPGTAVQQNGFHDPYASAGLADQLEQQPLNHGAQIQQLEQQLYDFRGLLKQTQERATALVNERDHRINMLDRLVEDQRHALDAQRRDAEELRRHQQELLMANREQAQRLTDLEMMLNSRDTSRSNVGSNMQARNVVDQKIIDVDRPLSQNLLGHDRIDQTIQEYLDSFPDFYFYVEKLKQGWYKFGKPISKKVYMKVVGNDIVVRVGGGYKELQKFLDEYRLEWLEGRAMLDSMEDMDQRRMMKRAMQNSRKML
mmetsp:Transcript_81856/g.144845  ORF Transcript_81856/g.144845 Transcript_81856/m.144845 type:complete len:603 (+) Transcript_81856:145-1953(+)